MNFEKFGKGTVLTENERMKNEPGGGGSCCCCCVVIINN